MSVSVDVRRGTGTDEITVTDTGLLSRLFPNTFKPRVRVYRRQAFTTNWCLCADGDSPRLASVGVRVWLCDRFKEYELGRSAK